MFKGLGVLGLGCLMISRFKGFGVLGFGCLGLGCLRVRMLKG